MAWTATKSWGTEVFLSADANTYISDNDDYLYDNKALANQWLNGTINVAQTNQRIETGTENVGLSTSSWGSVTVTYNTAFGTAPRIVATVVNPSANSDTFVSIIGNGTGGCTPHVWVRTGTATATVYVNWLAIGA